NSPMADVVLLVRHASPDWSRTDLRYDVPPGPPLTPAGEEEATALGHFLKTAGVTRILYSPLERTTRTAQLAAAQVGLTPQVDEAIAEWQRGEPENDVLDRFLPRIQAALDASREEGLFALVTHGGPIRLLLAEFGLDKAELDYYRRLFDRDNPVPPAGVWRIERSANGRIRKPELVYTPNPYQAYQPATVNV